MSDTRDPILFIAPANSLSTDARKQLKERGVIVIESKRWDCMRLVRAESEVDSGAMLSCALEAITEDAFLNASARFVKKLSRLLKAREES